MVFKKFKKNCCGCRNKKRNGSHNDEPSFVMGNSNATFNTSLHKQNSIGCESDIQNSNVTDVYTQREISGAVVIDKKNKNNKSEVKAHVRQNGFIKSSKIKNSKYLQKEIDELNNLLIEKNNQINELQVSLKNNNNKQEEKTKHDNHVDLQNELKIKNKSILELDKKLTSTQSLIDKSSKGLDALTVVIQYYITQVEQISQKLSLAHEKNHSLKETNGVLLKDKHGLEVEIQDLISKLDIEKNRCETLQREVETIGVNHEIEVRKIRDQQNTEEIELRNSLTEESERKIKKVTVESEQKVENQKYEHENEMKQLNEAREKKVQQLKETNDKPINEIKTQHDQLIKDKDLQHLKYVEDLREKHEEECKELEAKLESITTEKTAVDNRLNEVMKQLENDTKVQAVLKYKHLPAELESLQVVLDMKNEELKNIRVKNMELEKKVEDYYDLQSKYDSISQENQSLTEALKNKAQLERQISVERDSLMEKFERESRKVARLSMEKEQLMWRASNPNLSYSSPSIFYEEEEEGEVSPPSSLRSSGSLSTTPPKTTISNKMKRRSMNFPLSKSDFNLH